MSWHDSATGLARLIVVPANLCYDAVGENVNSRGSPPGRRAYASFAAFLLLAGGGFLQAQEPVVLRSSRLRYDIGRSVSLLEDPRGMLSAADALGRASSFEPSGEDEPSMGFSSSVFWARFSLRSEAPGTAWILEIAHAPTDRIDLFEVRDGRAAPAGMGGDTLPLSQVPWPGRTPRFRLDLKAGVPTEYLLRVYVGGFAVLPIRVWEIEEFLRQDRLALLVLGIYFGIGGECLWPQYPALNNHLVILGATGAVAFSTLFTRELLQKGKWVPLLPALITTNTTLIVFSFVFIAAAIATLRRGCTPARVYFIAWAALLLAVLFFGLRNFRLVPWTVSRSPLGRFVERYVLQIGSVFEVVLLSLALSDRINTLRNQAGQAERELRMSRERELKATEEKLYFDGLTGLPNRNKLLADSAGRRELTLYLVNIDRFSHINDFFGNRIGDAVIVELKRRIEACLPQRPGVLYRLHADEYALVTQGEAAPEQCLEFGRKLRSSCHDEPVSVDGERVRLSVSIGIARKT